MLLGSPRHHFASLDSTSLLLKRLAADGAAPGTLVTADAQTAGYGQRGRQWASAPGDGLYLSVLLPTPAMPTQLPFVVGLACQEALESYVSGVGLKWVNDLVADGRKLGGILVEVSRGGAIVGIGLNLRTPPLDEAIGLEALGATPSSEALLETLLAHLSDRHARWSQEGFAPVLEAWGRASVTLGRAIQVIGDAPLAGHAEALGPQGELLVRSPDGVLHTVISGSVRAATGAYC
ncbi:MAG TPA: biotin--[acetyl-CoA-carboxylase] ligase [Oscillatoriaceae cyanobacterium]